QIIPDLGGDADPSNDRLELNATLTNTSKRPCVGCSGGRIGCVNRMRVVVGVR
ncbi:hypothetical protein H3T89_08835, partial [Bifidobacterium sp. W8114]|nr:hypothetical protein [Bifidobacterium asteroides]MBI0100440.1 hypothetical protein [Bifidobacterium sp. W8114]